ncbi:MAG TPA: DUF1028 domain-containing protein [Pseudonocardia sp.]
MTYSIVARDAATGELGFGSQSHFYGVGRLVGWGEAGVGVTCTQAFVNVGYGPGAIAAMREGGDPADIVKALTGADEHSAYRQLAVLDASGRVASHTGSSCAPSAAGLVGDGVAVQGNMLGSPDVVPDMLAAYEAAAGQPLAYRILAAMTAAERAGGDVRGSQSAVLRTFTGERSDTPWAQVQIDIRVDDHEDPIGELTRLLPRQRAFDLIGGVIFAPNLTIGAYEGVDPGELQEKVEGLAKASELLGEQNREADFWRALLLARSGDKATAKPLFVALFEARPALRGFLAGIGPLGFLDNVTEYTQ